MNRGDRRAKGDEVKVCVGIVLALVVPAVIALRSVRIPQSLISAQGDPTPLGYTRSLALFAVPAAALAWWFLRHLDYRFQRRAFGRSLALLVPLGFLLDILRASAFFTFVNRDATLGIAVPVVGGTVPVEEFLFYVLGFVVTLLIYIWADEYWMGAYKVPDLRPEDFGVAKVVRFHWPSLLVGVALIAAGILYRRLSTTEGGFPGYFVFLVAHAIVPSLFLFPTARPFINWRALSFTFLMLVLVSMFWEATLAIPYQWWGFQRRQMLGLSILAWSGLPVEEVLVWVAVSYTTVIVYHVVKVFLALEKPWLEALFGSRRRGGEAAR